MSGINITFLDDNEATLHEKMLAHLIAEALVFKIRLESEDDTVKYEKRKLTATK